MESIELFTGAGGLGIGISQAGFSPLALVERDQWCCDTIRENKQAGHPWVKDWPIYQADVSKFEYSTFEDRVELLAGGPPCQPFSLGGKHRAHLDDRDMFPEVVRAIRATKPKAIIIENVKGLMRKQFATYFEYILLQMTYPEISKSANEDWVEHRSRLEQHHTSDSESGLRYNVVFGLLNSANYGIPQKRERVFFVGFRSDLKIPWSFNSDLPQTHTYDRLLWDQWVSREYWERHGLKQHRVPKNLTRAVNHVASRLDTAMFEPWRTVRDAISDLPDPRLVPKNKIPNHRFTPGARSYKGHTGSPFDLPAKTLKAGDHGVPGGENTLRHRNGKVRYFTVREAARLQSFPDDYVFHGAWSETMRQLGNAVPVELGRLIATSVRLKLESAGG